MSTIVRENIYSLLECVCQETGALIWEQIPSKQMQKKINEGKPIKRNIKPDHRTSWKNPNGGRPTRYPYSAISADSIVRLIFEKGYSLSKIARISGIPVQVFYYWMKRYKDFKIEVKNAKECHREKEIENEISYRLQRIKQQ